MKKLLALTILLLPTLIVKASATFNAGATYYVQPKDDVTGVVGNDSTGDGTLGNPYQTSTRAWAVNSGGNNYIIINGTYSGTDVTITTFAAGTAANLTWIKAQTEWRVKIKNTSGLTLNAATNVATYWGIRGIIFDYAGEKDVVGHHGKIINCGFRGGGSIGNVSGLVIGSNDYNFTSTITIQGCHFWGPGARYNFLVYNSQNIIAKYNVTRHDGGWDDAGAGDPQGGVTCYLCSDSLFLDNIVLDSTGPYVGSTGAQTWEAGFMHISNTSASNIARRNRWIGNMAIRVAGQCFNKDDGSDSQGNILQDNLCIDSSSGAWSGGTGPSSFTFINNTFMLSSFTFSGGSGGYQQAIAEFCSAGCHGHTVKDTIIANYSDTGGRDFNGNFSYSYIDDYNVTNKVSPGTGFQSINPSTAGLTYITRVESGTALSTLGSTGGRIGAEIRYKIGGDESWWGDPGYDVVTTQDLWTGDFPNGAQVRADLCTEATGKRGWCNSNQTLNSWINGYISNGISPYADNGSGGGGGGGSGGTGTPQNFSRTGTSFIQGSFTIK